MCSLRLYSNSHVEDYRRLVALRLGLYAPDTQVIPVAPIYYCNFDRPLYGHISFSKFGGLKGAMFDGAVGTEGAGLIRGLPP